MFRHYIYNTRLPEHPHSPIQKYERHPQVPAIWTRHMESCLDTARFYATSTSMSIVLAPPPMSRFLQALQRCFKSLSIAASVIQSELYHKNWHVWLGHRFWLDSTRCFWFYSTHCFWLDLTQFFSDFTHVECIYFWFKSNHSIKIPVRLQGVLHWLGCLRNNPT